MTIVWTIMSREGHAEERMEVAEVRKSTERRDDVNFQLSLTVHSLVGK
jgi:hypothetical protein